MRREALEFFEPILDDDNLSETLGGFSVDTLHGLQRQETLEWDHQINNVTIWKTQAGGRKPTRVGG